MSVTTGFNEMSVTRILENQVRRLGQEATIKWCEEMMDYAGNIVGPLTQAEQSLFRVFDDFRWNLISKEWG